MITFDKQQCTPHSQKKVTLFNNYSKFTFFDAILEIYHATLDCKNFQAVKIPAEAASWAKTLYKENGHDPDLVTVYGGMKSESIQEDINSIFHMVTAGKDSTATALKFEGQFNDSKLIHVVGVNKMYPTENRKAKPLYEDQSLFPNSKYEAIKVSLPRVTNGTESPIKNMFIIALSIAAYNKIPKWVTLGGSEKIADISETEVYGDTSAGLTPFLTFLNSHFKSTLGFTPYLRDQVEAYEVLTNHNVTYDRMASCMTQLRFKKLQRNKVVKDFTVQIKGKAYLAGTVEATGQSIHELSQAGLDLLSPEDLTHMDIIAPEDYRCLKCFKCNEKALVHSHHMSYQYPKKYIADCKRLLIAWMDKSPNTNGINLMEYFEYVLGIPKETIDSKYHPYMLGTSIRPLGWKPPKPVKKKEKKA